jgi:hypothetical protein
MRLGVKIDPETGELAPGDRNLNGLRPDGGHHETVSAETIAVSGAWALRIYMMRRRSDSDPNVWNKRIGLHRYQRVAGQWRRFGAITMTPEQYLSGVDHVRAFLEKP